MVKIKGFNTANADLSSLNGFSDKDSISESAMSYVAVAVQKGLINGFEDNRECCANRVNRIIF